MDPERLAAELRPRTVFESVDFGFAAARRWWRPVWTAWLIGWTPVYLLTWGLLMDWPWAPVLILWWIKPLFGRLPLWVLGSALFGDTPDARRVISKAGILTEGALGALTWRRLDPFRSFHAPVSVLEGGTASAQARRRAVLRSGTTGGAAWLSLICFLLKWTLFIGLLGCFFALVPDRPELSLDEAWVSLEAGEPPFWLVFLLLFADFTAMSLVEPLYVAGGFGLYINRRSDLEGWDVAINFHRIARRIAAIGAALLLALGLLHGGPAQAEDTGELAYEPGGGEAPSYESPFYEPDVDAVVEEVLSDPEFGEDATETRWRLREDLKRYDLNCKPDPLPEVAPACGGGMAGASQTGLMVLLGMAVVVLLIVILRRVDRPGLPQLRSGPTPERTQGETLFPEELPEHLGQAAWAAWSRGQHMLALAMLYKGALVRLTENGMPITDGMTEGEARRLVARRAAPEVSGVFDRLTRVWQLAAYAHRMPEDEVVRVLCDEWPQAFGEAP
ncbi:MAG: DUF4129 domain-containing protein [Alphaproteobacteria bacterium]|nr:DUF4129 domain-containing protein [Alphaproteobacteria bacterium]